jgi:hypothetical protein
MEPEEQIETGATETDAPEEEEALRDWLPFTLRGCAALARGPWWRLFLVELAVALFVGACCVWVVGRHWCPAIDQAIAALPHNAGEIRDGRLHWPNAKPLELTQLPDRPYLRLIVDPQNAADHGRMADLQLELRERHVAVSSVLGFWKIPYPPGLALKLDRENLGPWWGARRPFLLLGLGVAVMLWLLFTWAVLALLGAWPVRMVSFFADREGGLGTHWRLASAAFQPGAVFCGMGILCYGLGLLPLLGLMLVWLLHLVVVWAYLFFAPFHLPQIEEEQLEDNPFSEPDQEDEEEPAGDDNPFPESTPPIEEED